MQRGSWDEGVPWVTPTQPTGSDAELAEIGESSNVPAARSLRDLEKSLDDITNINSRQENRIETLQSKINELIGFYLVFQGVILTSVAQGSFLRCDNWWLPFALSCIAAAAIIMAVLHMLLKLSLSKIELDKNRWQHDRLQVLIMARKQRPILRLSTGSMEDVSNHSYQSQHDVTMPSLSLMERVYRAAYPTIVLITLLTFTAFILFGCHRILCFPGPPPDPSQTTSPDSPKTTSP